MVYPSQAYSRRVILLILAMFAFPMNGHGLKVTILPENYVTPLKFAEYYNGEKFDSLAGLFLYPQNQSAKLRADDSAVYVSIFRSMHKQWSGITSFTKSNGPNRWNVAARFAAGDSISIRETINICTDVTYISIEYENRIQFILRFIQHRHENRYLIGVLDFVRNISVNPKQSQKDETIFQNQINKVLNDAGQGNMK